MKKLLLIVLLSACVLSVGAFAGGAPGTGFWVGTNAVKIAAHRRAKNPPAWQTATVYSQGDYCKVTMSSLYSRYYMALDGGTSGANQPTNTFGEFNDGGVTWYKIPDGSRLGIDIQLKTTGVVDLAVGYAPESPKGGSLVGYGECWTPMGSGSTQPDGSTIYLQDEIFAVSRSGSNYVGVMEW